LISFGTPIFMLTPKELIIVHFLIKYR